MKNRNTISTTANNNTDNNEKETRTMKNTKKTRRITKTVSAALAAIMMMTSAASVMASATTRPFDTNGISIVTSLNDILKNESITGTYCSNIEFKYSDDYFTKNPDDYDPSLATMSFNMADASTTYIVNGDYSDGAHYIHDLLTKIKFKGLYANKDYYNKPTNDSVGCAIGYKTINDGGKLRKVISITIRSANYESEWASNVTLGVSDEAKGFADSAYKVLKCFTDEYLAKYPELKTDLAKGNVSFWVQGFSRGGAIANITSKYLIDKYQYDGNKVYGYCFEAPQGGSRYSYIPGKNYDSIHNVINKDDLVPYVAPTKMGFRRYGVDHYLNDDPADHEDLHKSKEFPNNISDNDINGNVSKKTIRKVRKEIRNIVGEGDISEHMPYTVTGKKLNIIGLSIDDTNVSTSDAIKRVMDAISKNVSREDYAKKGYQAAARRLMQFFTSGADLKGLKDTISISSIVIDMLPEIIIKHVVGPGLIVEVLETGIQKIYQLFGGDEDDEISRALDVSIQVKNTILDCLSDSLKKNGKILKKLEKYEGGGERAIEDLNMIAKAALDGGLHDIDDILTLGMNIEGIFQNHSTVQTLAWLRAYDPLYAEKELVKETNASSTVVIPGTHDDRGGGVIRGMQIDIF